MSQKSITSWSHLQADVTEFKIGTTFQFRQDLMRYLQRILSRLKSFIYKPWYIKQSTNNEYIISSLDALINNIFSTNEAWEFASVINKLAFSSKFITPSWLHLTTLWSVFGCVLQTSTAVFFRWKTNFYNSNLWCLNLISKATLQYAMDNALLLYILSLARIRVILSYPQAHEPRIKLICTF